MLGAAWVIAPLGRGSGGGAPPIGGRYANGYLSRLRRIIAPAIHQMPTGGEAWALYRRTHLSLRSEANGGKVADETLVDMRFENGSGLALKYELEGWSPTTGLTVAWVRLSGFRQGAPYVLFHYFGKPEITSAEQDREACWAGFHQSNNLATGADRSGNGRDFTLTGVVATTVLGAAAGDFA